VYSSVADCFEQGALALAERRESPDDVPHAARLSTREEQHHRLARTFTAPAPRR
jgi:hypothetical protein